MDATARGCGCYENIRLLGSIDLCGTIVEKMMQQIKEEINYFSEVEPGYNDHIEEDNEIFQRHFKEESKDISGVEPEYSDHTEEDNKMLLKTPYIEKSKNQERKRSVKTSAEQYKIYLDFMNSHPVFKSGRLTPDIDGNKLENLWKELVVQLNSCGSGPQKDVKGWKTVFTDWKSAVKRKGRLYLLEMKKMRGGPIKAKPLNELENELLQTIGPVLVHDIEEVAETSGLEDLADTTLPFVMEVPVDPEPLRIMSHNSGLPTDTTFANEESTPRPPPRSEFQDRRNQNTSPKVVKAFRESSQAILTSLNKINVCMEKLASAQTRLANSQEELVQIKKMKLKLEILMARKDGVQVDFDV